SLARTVLVFLSRTVTVDLPILPLAGASISSLYRGAFALVVMSHLHLAPQDDMAAAAADDGRLPGAGRPFRPQATADGALPVLAGTGEPLADFGLPLRRGVAGVPAAQPLPGHVVAQGQVAGQEAGELVTDIIPALALAQVGQLSQVGGDAAGEVAARAGPRRG